MRKYANYIRPMQGIPTVDKVLHAEAHMFNWLGKYYQPAYGSRPRYQYNQVIDIGNTMRTMRVNGDAGIFSFFVTGGDYHQEPTSHKE